MSYQNNAESVGLENGVFRARLTSSYVLTPSDVAPGGTFAGLAQGLIVYGFLEQTIDPATGVPADAFPGRQSYPPNSTTPNLAFAVEVNNCLADKIGRAHV